MKKLEKIEITQNLKKYIYLKRQKKIRRPPPHQLTHSILVVQTHFDYVRKVDWIALFVFLLRPRDVTLERVFSHIPPCSRVYTV